MTRPRAKQYSQPHLQEDQQQSHDIFPIDHNEVRSFVSFGEITERHAVRSVAFSPDGTRIAIGTNGRALKVLACPSVNEASTVLHQPTGSGKKHGGGGGEEEEAAQVEGTSSLIIRPSVLTEFDGLHLGSVYDVSWSPDSSLLTTCSNDMTVKVVRAPLAPNQPFDIQTRADRDAGDLPVGTLRGHDGTVRAVCFTGDGTIVSGGAGDCLLRTWDPKRSSLGGALATLKGHTGAIFSLCRGDVPAGGGGGSSGAGGFGPSTVVSGSEDRSVRVWDLRAGGKCVSSIGADPSLTHLEDGTPAAAKSAVQSLSVCPSAVATVATGHEDGNCCIWDLRAGRLLWMLRAHESQCRSVDYDCSGRWILSASFDGTVGIADTDVWERRVVANFDGHSGKVLRAVWNPKACMFASSSADSTVKLWAPSVPRAAAGQRETQTH
jgi:WD40 repeat protein